MCSVPTGSCPIQARTKTCSALQVENELCNGFILAMEEQIGDVYHTRAATTD